MPICLRLNNVHSIYSSSIKIQMKYEYHCVNAAMTVEENDDHQASVLAVQ